MRLGERQAGIDAALLRYRAFWHPQPFREVRPGWCAAWPALTAELLALDDAAVARLNDDGTAALGFLARHVPDLAELLPLVDIPICATQPLPQPGARWDWEIPGRKREQIAAFAAAARNRGRPVLDWCGGKGHLGRLLAKAWEVPVETLEIDPVLCAAGEALAARAGADQDFRAADVLAVSDRPGNAQHVVALHACGDLHRHLIRRGAEQGVSRLDLAPCCYYRGVAEVYRPLSAGLTLGMTRDDTRLAVTETVTASAREALQRDRAMAWKLGWDAWRRAATGEPYRSFKPVPESLLRGDFPDFLAAMMQREGFAEAPPARAMEFEVLGWQRQREVMRLSIVRHAFRRALELWLVLDLAGFLAAQGYVVDVGCFCARQLSPRNLLISAERG